MANLRLFCVVVAVVLLAVAALLSPALRDRLVLLAGILVAVALVV